MGKGELGVPNNGLSSKRLFMAGKMVLPLEGNCKKGSAQTKERAEGMELATFAWGEVLVIFRGCNKEVRLAAFHHQLYCA
jgi:hypothetical protein